MSAAAIVLGATAVIIGACVLCFFGALIRDAGRGDDDARLALGAFALLLVVCGFIWSLSVISR